LLFLRSHQYLKRTTDVSQSTLQELRTRRTGGSIFLRTLNHIKTRHALDVTIKGGGAALQRTHAMRVRETVMEPLMEE